MEKKNEVSFPRFGTSIFSLADWTNEVNRCAIWLFDPR